MEGLFLVLSDRGPYGFSLFDMTEDEERARATTRNIRGTLVRVPVEVLADYRGEEQGD